MIRPKVSGGLALAPIWPGFAPLTPTLIPDPADPPVTPVSAAGEPFEIPMAPPTVALSDTLPPSVGPAAEPAPIGTIERMGHTIQGLQGQNEVLRNTVEALSSSVATMAAAAAASRMTTAAGVTADGPGSGAPSSSSAGRFGAPSSSSAGPGPLAELQRLEFRPADPQTWPGRWRRAFS